MGKDLYAIARLFRLILHSGGTHWDFTGTVVYRIHYGEPPSSKALRLSLTLKFFYWTPSGASVSGPD
ncbi:hypothetical protein Y1Q_0007124 [Alligator mississippiensis]|uniref:Uncharacterized protein n=1 Tax=Alligator mississippiensis TaxID=8496 RepID=A0A151N5Y4_ALLMI|nr:hypothetical protein Y1Q_0007124 [Alligator mississippiensis]